MCKHILLVSLLAALLVTAIPARADDNLEYAVKAAYLAKFIPFIGWPDTAAISPFTICVLGPDPFGVTLDHATAGQKIGNKPLRIQRMAVLDPAASCSLLFLGGADVQTASDALAVLKNKPVVTVTDSNLHVRGVISFVLVDDHVRFDIDDANAARNGIQISSKLLELAHAVWREDSGAQSHGTLRKMEVVDDPITDDDGAFILHGRADGSN